MTRLAANLVVGFLAGRMVWLAAGPAFAAPALARSNHRGRAVPTAAGLVLPVAVALVEGGRALADAVGIGARGTPAAHLVVLATAAGFALVGVIDDLVGTGDDRGFRGHLRALAEGRPTTGFLKLAGGAALAVAVVAPVTGTGAGRLMADAALVALCANLANQFDRAPGRAIKVVALGFVVIAVAAEARRALDGVAVMVGAGLGLALDDLHEHLMLGDAGSNALGAVVGVGVVLATRPAVRTAALVAVAALNLVGEMVSFTRVIDAVPPLRALDRAGRRQP